MDARDGGLERVASGVGLPDSGGGRLGGLNGAEGGCGRHGRDARTLWHGAQGRRIPWPRPAAPAAHHCMDGFERRCASW